MSESLQLTIPVPPSVNHAYATVKGRQLSIDNINRGTDTVYLYAAQQLNGHNRIILRDIYITVRRGNGMSQRAWTAVEDATLRHHYSSKTRAELCALLARSPASVRARCMRLGLNTKHPRWSASELDSLRAFYADGADFDLDRIAAALGRSKTVVCGKAGELGLTVMHRRTPRTAASSTANLMGWREENEHPRGALGMKHTEEARRKMSVKGKARASRTPPEVVAARVEKSHLTKLRRYGVAGGAIGVTNPYSRAKRGKRADLGGVFFRSKWEANYARYLRFLKSKGEIREWEYEPHTFVFHGVTRGVITYTPDFRVTERDGSKVWHEVKGWMDAKSKAKLKRMAKFYPDEKLIVIGPKEYKAVGKYSALIEGWE